MSENLVETRTFLLTDVQGSTPLWEHFPAAMSQAMARHDSLIETIVKEHHGRTVRPRGEGDSRFLVFQYALDAVQAAVAIQAAFQAEPWPQDLSFTVRMALNTGEGEYREGDYYGTAVNRCARLRGLAHGGQILISQGTHELIVDRLPGGFKLLDLGEHPLRGLTRPEIIYQVVAPGLASEFPPLQSGAQLEHALPSAIAGKKPGFLGTDPSWQPPAPPVFVARESELAWLNSALDSARGGKGRVVFIGGGPGRGKTALADYFVRRALELDPNLIAARGVCHAYTGVGDPYAPFREVMGMLTGDLESHWTSGMLSTRTACTLWEFVPAVLEAILTHGPHLPGVFIDPKAMVTRAFVAMDSGASLLNDLTQSLNQKPDSVGDLEQGYLFEQYTNVLLALSAIRPMILLLDDMQWADSSSASLLFHLGRRLMSARILVVCTYRPEEVSLGGALPQSHSTPSSRHPLEKLLTEFKRKYGDVVLDLGGPDVQAGRGFVDAYLDTQPNQLGEDFRQALFQHTAGHPLFTIELLRELAARGDIYQQDGVWIQGPTLNWQVLPARVEGVIEERLDHLDNDLRELLDIASVEGVHFTSQVLAQVQGMDDLKLYRLLKHELEDRHRLVKEQGEVQVGDCWLGRYQFSHFLFQQHLYASLSQGERRVLHRSIGKILESFYAGRESEIAVKLALHFAGDPNKERRYTKLAGNQAAKNHANQEALAHYSRALALTPADDLAGRYRLLISREAIHNITANRSAQKQDLEALQTLLSKLAGSEQDPGSAEVAVRWANYYGLTDYQGAGRMAERAVELAVSEGRRDVAAKAYLAWADIFRVRGDHPAAIQQAETGLAVAREIGDLRTERILMNTLGLIKLDQGDRDGARAVFERSLDLASEHGDQATQAQLLNNLGNIAGNISDFGASQHYYQRALKLAREIGDRRGESLVLGNLGWLRGIQGDFQAAEKYYQQQRVIAINIGDRYQETYVAINLATALLAQGNPREALQYASQSLAIAAEIGDRSGIAWAQTTLGHIHTALEDLRAAETSYQAALELRRSMDQSNLAMEPLAGLAWISFQRGDITAAHQQVSEILAYLDGGGSLDGTEEPLRVLLTCCRVVAAVDQTRAMDILSNTHSLLMERADRIQDEGLRAKFLDNIPAHREVMEAWENCQL